MDYSPKKLYERSVGDINEYNAWSKENTSARRKAFKQELTRPITMKRIPGASKEVPKIWDTRSENPEFFASMIRGMAVAPMDTANAVIKAGQWQKLPQEEKLGAGVDIGVEALAALIPGIAGGQIKGVSRGAAKSIRKMMQAEKGLRASARQGKPKDFIRDLLEGVWFHGRETYPKAGKSFAESRTKSSRKYLGEPVGISLTKDPEVARGFSKSYKNVEDFISKPKMGKYFTPDLPETAGPKQFSRTFPLFKGDPLDKVLNVGTKEGHEVYKQAYSETVEDIFKEFGESSLKLDRYSYPQKKQGILNYNDFREYMERGYRKKHNLDLDDPVLNYSIGESVVEDFNERLTQKLKDRGYKGFLWNPKRGGGEAELRWLDPEDLRQVDFRRKVEVDDIIRPKGLTTPERNEFIKSGNYPSHKAYSERVTKPTLKQWEKKSAQGTTSIQDMLSDEIDFAEIFDKTIPGYGSAKRIKEKTKGMSDLEWEVEFGKIFD